MILSSQAIPTFLQSYIGKPDPRVENWALLNSPLNVLVIYILYATIILGGTKIMRNRKQFDLKNVLIVYNSFQILSAAYVCKEIFVTAYLAGYKLSCTPLDTSNSKLAIRMTNAFWCFYVSKIIDLMDTVFFVLRKKNSQLTFLHIYHHSSMVCNWYIGVLYIPGGQAFLCAGINSFIHVIMYSYYLLTAMGPKMQKYLWWKRYLTQIQLVQFVVVMVHIVLGIRNGCQVQSWLSCMTLTYLGTLVFLFINFYITAYKKKSKSICHLDLQNTKAAYADVDIKAGGDLKLD